MEAGEEEAKLSFKQIFCGRLLQEVTCYGCSAVSRTLPDFVDLSVEITNVNSIEKAICDFFEPKIIGDIGKKSSLYKCNGCQKNVLATSKSYIETAPPVLCIHLKRFRSLGENAGFMKIQDKIQLSREIKINHYCKDTNVKELKYVRRCMINHEGSSPYSGHYTALVEGKMDHFYEFSDEKVKTVTAQELLSSSSYVVYYEMVPQSWLTNIGQPDKAATHQKGSTLGQKKSAPSVDPTPRSAVPTPRPPVPTPSMSMSKNVTDSDRPPIPTAGNGQRSEDGDVHGELQSIFGFALCSYIC